MADPRIEPWSDSIAGGCWFEDALVISTCLELYRGRNYYQIIWEPRENLDSGQPLVSNPEDVEQDQGTDKFVHNFFRIRIIFIQIFTWFELYYSNKYKRLKFFQSVLCGSVAKTWIQLFTLFSNHPGASFTSNFFLWKQNQIFREETEIIISGI